MAQLITCPRTVVRGPGKQVYAMAATNRDFPVEITLAVPGGHGEHFLLALLGGGTLDIYGSPNSASITPYAVVGFMADPRNKGVFERLPDLLRAFASDGAEMPVEGDLNGYLRSVREGRQMLQLVWGVLDPEPPKPNFRGFVCPANTYADAYSAQHEFITCLRHRGIRARIGKTLGI